jgi:hypothetical protein
MENYRNITLCIDIMFVNRIPFFLSISKNIRFITAEVLDNRKLGYLVNALRRINGIYKKRGFRITNIFGDGEFECTRGAVATDIRSELHICGEDEHVPDIERCIRTTKERTRCTYNSMPIQHYPPRLIIEMVSLSIFWLNAFPHRLGVLQTLSPRTIVTGLHIDYTKHCQVAFGQYVQTHEKHNNSIEARTIGAPALRPTGNAQGVYYFYSLMSGQRIHRTGWTKLPMPAEVQDRVHTLARRANATRGLTFTDSDGRDLDTLFPASYDDDDSDYDPNQDDQASYASSEDSNYDGDAAHPDTDGTHADVDGPNFNPGLPAHGPAAIAGVDGDNTTADPGATPGVDDETPGVDDETTGVDDETTGVDEEHDEANLKTYVNELEAELDEEIAGLDSNYDPEHSESDIDLDNNVTPVGENEINEINAGATREQTNADNDLEHAEDSDDEHISDKDGNTPIPRLRRNITPSFKHLKGRDGDGSLPTVAQPHKFRGGKYQAHVILQSIIFTQYNLKQGIRKFGNNGKAAVLVELQQLYDQSVMDPINKYDLTAEERKGALRYLMFLKENAVERLRAAAVLMVGNNGTT